APYAQAFQEWKGTGVPGYPAIPVVEYSSQRLDNNPLRARCDSHPRKLGLLRIRQQQLLSELCEQSLADSGSSRKCRVWHSVSHGGYHSLFHNEEHQTKRRIAGG